MLYYTSLIYAEFGYLDFLEKKNLVNGLIMANQFCKFVGETLAICQIGQCFILLLHSIFYCASYWVEFRATAVTVCMCLIYF